MGHGGLQLARSLGLTVDQIRGARLALKCAQPFEKLGRIGMVAKLLERGNLGANRHHLAKNLHLRLATFDPKAPRSRRLEANEDDGVSRVRKSLREMMLNPSTGYHPARRNNDARELRLVDLLRLFWS